MPKIASICNSITIMPIAQKWNESQQGESITNKFLDRIKSQDPLKPRIEEAQNRLEVQISKLEKFSGRLHDKDKAIFGRIVHAIQSADSFYATVLSNELSQVRRVSKMVDSTKLALGQIQMRLNTVTELGDLVVTLSPAMSAIQGIQTGLSSMMPKADQSFGEISELFGSIMAQSNQIPTTTASETAGNSEVSEEAMKIMEEASALIEENAKSKFPDPSLLREGKNTESSYIPSSTRKQTATSLY